MRGKLILKIKKPSQAEALLWTILVLPFLFGFLIELLGLPSVINYVCDIMWLWLLLLLMLQRGRKMREEGIFLSCVGFFLIYTLLGYIINFQSPFYYLWGLRNNFRLYVVFFGLIAFAKQDTCNRMLNFFDQVFWLNAAVCFLQFFVFGKQQDYLGGLFGAERGCNAYLNNYFVIVTIKVLLQNLNGERKLAKCILKCGTMLLISALAELKFYYIEFIVILIMAMLLTDFSWKKVLIIAGGFAGLVLGVRLLVALFPEFEGTFTLRAIYEMSVSSKGYTGSGDLNRLNAIGVISERFLKSWPERLVGLGLGNADNARFDFLTTPFYNQYSALNYSWFSMVMIFLETGYLGLLFFFGFYILVYLRAGKLAKKNGQNTLHCQMAMICAACCVLISIYNSSLRMEAGYMMYYMLALPFIRKTSNGKLPAQPENPVTGPIERV